MSDLRVLEHHQVSLADLLLVVMAHDGAEGSDRIFCVDLSEPDRHPLTMITGSCQIGVVRVSANLNLTTATGDTSPTPAALPWHNELDP